MPSPPGGRRTVRRLPEPKPNPFYFRIRWTALRYLEIAVGAVLLLPIRLLLIVVVCLPTVLVTKLVAANLAVSAEGYRFQKPWQRMVMRGLVSTIFGRLIVWLCGFTWVRTYGKQADFRQAPIMVVSPHTSLFDAFITGAYLHGSYVSLKENSRFPFIGDLLAASETIWIDQKKKDDCAMEFQQRLKSPDQAQPIILFPEGTVHTPGSLVEFKMGAFKYGLPVQPVAFRFSGDPGWSIWSHHHSLIASLLHPLCVLYNPAEIHYLPVYTPSKKERCNPELFAANVRETIARQMGLRVSDHSKPDMVLTGMATELGLPHFTGNVEYVVMRDVLHLNLDRLKVLLARFAELDANKDGFVTQDDFASNLGWPAKGDVAEFFSLCDTAGRGKISFREYAVAYADVIRPHEQDLEQLAGCAPEVMRIDYARLKQLFPCVSGA